MTIAEWSYLKCDCGGELFTPLTKLKYKTDGGTIAEPAGYYCVACHGQADTRRLAHLIDLDRKRRQVKDLQAEIAAAEPVKAAATK